MKRGDRDIENLFNAVQNTIDARDTSIERCRNLSESNLPLLKIKLTETLALCENVLTRDENTEAVNKAVMNLMQFMFGFLMMIIVYCIRRRKNLKKIVPKEMMHGNDTLMI